MKKLSGLSLFFMILGVSFFMLALVFSSSKLRDFHTKYYSSIADPIFNLLNPHVFAQIEPGAPENENRWGITFMIWDKREYDERIHVKRFREANPPKGILYQNPHELFLIPSLFLISLFIASPVPWRKKILRFLLGLLLFYLVMTFYLSYRFEFTLNNQTLPLDSFWHVLISFFGLGGTTDPIFIVALLIWLFLIGPLILKKPEVKKILRMGK